MQTVRAGAGFEICVALRHRDVPISSAGVSSKSHGGEFFGVFLATCFFMAFSMLCRGVLGIPERVFTQPWRRRLCGGVRRCPCGWRGREGPGDGIAFLLLPLPGKEATFSCQYRPLGRCADVCVLLHVGVRASLSSAQGWCCSLLKSPWCFLLGDLCCSFLCASPSSSPAALASPLLSHPAFPSVHPGWLQALHACPCSFLPSRCRTMPLSPCQLCGVRCFPGLHRCEFSWHHSMKQALPVSSEG